MNTPTTPAEAIQMWNDGNKEKNIAEQKIKLAQAALRSMEDVELDVPIYKNIGVIQQTKREFRVPVDVLTEYAPDKIDEFMIVDKKAFEDYIKSTMTEEQIKEIKSKYIVTGETSYLKLKSYGDGDEDIVL
jgi:hypothetical protein